jgi:tetratricopeptide (TPR) repeat protein
VSARPEPLAERARRWLKRRRTAVVAGAAALLVALVALAVSTTLLGTAYEAERIARGAADSRTAEAVEARQTAEAGFQLAQNTCGNLLSLAEDIKPAPGTQARSLERILLQARDQYAELRRVAGDRPDILEGEARVLTTLSALQIDLGSTKKALAFGQEAERLYRTLLDSAPDTPRYRAGLATARGAVGIALGFMGKFAEARAAHQDARDLRQRLADEQPDDPSWRVELGRSYNQLGTLHLVRGDWASAEVVFRRRLELCRQAVAQAPNNLAWQTELAWSLDRVALALFQQDRLSQAETFRREALGILDRVLTRDPSNVEWHRRRTAVALNLGLSIQWQGRGKEALPLFEQGLDTARRFAGLDPDHREWQRLVLQARRYLANTVTGQDQKTQLSDRLIVQRDLLKLDEVRARLDPDNVEWRIEQANSRLLATEVVISLVRLKAEPEAALTEAEKLADKSRADWEAVKSLLPEYHFLMSTQVAYYRVLSALYQSRGETARATQAMRQALQIMVDYYQRLYDAEPDNLYWLSQLVDKLRGLANQLSLIPETTNDAVTVSRRAVMLARRLVGKQPDSVAALATAAEALATNKRSLTLLATRHGKERHPDDAYAATKAIRESSETIEAHEREFERMGVLDRLIDLDVQNPRWSYELADSYLWLARQLGIHGDAAGADRAFQNYLAVLDRLYRLVPAEVQRDPLVAPDPTTRFHLVINVLLGTSPSRARQVLMNSEHLYGSSPRPERATELMHALVDLVIALQENPPVPKAELRQALRRGVALLTRPKAANDLPRPLAIQLPFFEKHLAEYPLELKVNLSPELRRAHDRMAYDELARGLLEEKRPRDLILLLDEEARATAGLEWARVGVTHLVLEDLLGDTGRLETLLKAVREVAGEDPTPLSPAGRTLLATLALYAGDGKTAALLDPKVAKAGPDQLTVENLSNSLHERRRFAGASRLAALYMAGLKDQATADHYAWLGQWHLEAGRLEEAEQAARNALALSANHTGAELVQVGVLNERRQFRQARARLEVLRDRPGLDGRLSRSIRTDIALARFDLGEGDEAEEDLRKLVQGDPADPSARLNLAWFLAQRGKDLDVAAEHVQAALAVAPRDPPSRAIQGAILVGQKKIKEGLEILEEVMGDEYLARQPEFLDFLAGAQHLAGQRDKARKTWQEALKHFPETTDPADRLRLAIQKQLKELEK